MCYISSYCPIGNYPHIGQHYGVEMGPNPKLISFVLKSALAASLVLTALILLLTAGTTPAAGSAELAGEAGDTQESSSHPEEQNEAAAEQDPTCQLSNAYPEKVRRWCEQIVEFATAHDLAPELIAAVILQESGGDPQAYSSSGAVGLMQVMPRDGIAAHFQCINGPCFASRPTIAELQDPEYNIEYGTRMLAGLLARHGDLRSALKAYGPMDIGYRYADTVLAIYENYR
jgi:soluble lytic murein transglycosylase-like protein